MNPYSKHDVLSLLSEKGIRLTKKRGQNFLLDRNTASRIAETAPNARASAAFEIGGGVGALTLPLSERYDALYTLEYDKGVYELLADAFPDVCVTHQDVLTATLADYPSPIDVYGNIPYNISSPILEWLLIKNVGRWSFAVFMVQKDFARRLLAEPGSDDYSALTLLAAFASFVRKEYDVGKNVFFPKPAVDSQVISLLPKPALDTTLFPLYRTIVKSAFHNRRKTLLNNLVRSPYMTVSRDVVEDAFATLSLPSAIRGERVAHETYEALARMLRTHDA